MKVVTCITDIENPGYKYALKASCKYYGLELVTIVAEDTEWSSHRNKDIELSKVLRTLNPEELILFTDGYDTFFIGNEESIITKYHEARAGKEILISGEKSCYPDIGLATQFDTKDEVFAFVNSGGIMAPVKVFIEALDIIKGIKLTISKKGNPFPFSNQYLWALFYLENQNLINIDHQCVLFQTLTPKMVAVRNLREMDEDINLRKDHAIKEFQEVNLDFELNTKPCLKNKVTGQNPVHMHFNSPLSKYNMFQEPYVSWIESFNN